MSNNTPHVVGGGLRTLARAEYLRRQRRAALVAAEPQIQHAAWTHAIHAAAVKARVQQVTDPAAALAALLVPPTA